MSRIWVAAVGLAFVSLTGAWGAENPHKAKPAWLAPFPGANVQAESTTETSFETPAKPEDVVAHYGKLLTAAGLPFMPNFDGVGTSIRAAAAECDLLIKVRESDLGSFARVHCQAREAGAASPLYGTDVGIANPEPPPPPAPDKPATPEKSDDKAADKPGDKPGDKPPASEQPKTPPVSERAKRVQRIE